MCWMKLCWTKCVGCNFVKIIENKLHQMCFCTFLCFNFHLHFFLSFFLISFIIFHHSYIGFFLSYSFSSFNGHIFYNYNILLFFNFFFFTIERELRMFQTVSSSNLKVLITNDFFWYINFILNNALMNEDLKDDLFTI